MAAWSLWSRATCPAPDPGIVMVVPSWWEPVHVPVWMPDQPETVLAKDAVAGHVTVQSDRPKQDELTRNSLVHFADWSAREPLAGITAALERLQRRSLALGIFVVLPQGAFDVSRRELESRLASITERFQLPVQVTEDDEGGWTRTFSVSKVPSTYLINARRKFVWSREGDVDPGELAAALEKHATPAPAPRARPLRLAVSPGERAPDAMFQTDREEPMALHRLRTQGAAEFLAVMVGAVPEGAEPSATAGRDLEARSRPPCWHSTAARTAAGWRRSGGGSALRLP